LNINGKVYDFGDVSVKLPGTELIVQEISYSDELEKELAYGKGHKPRGYGTGNYKADGKLSLLKEDYDQLINYCKQQGVAFYSLVISKIIVSYANGEERTTSDVLNKVTFTKANNKAAQGDKSLKIDIDFLIVGEIKRNGLNAV
jgi:hypothetical protein